MREVEQEIETKGEDRAERSAIHQERNDRRVRSDWLGNVLRRQDRLTIFNGLSAFT